MSPFDEWVIVALLLILAALCAKLYQEIRHGDYLIAQAQGHAEQASAIPELRAYIRRVSGLLCEMGNTPATWNGTAFRCSGCGAMARDPVNLDHKPDCVIGRCERLGVEGRYLVDR